MTAQNPDPRTAPEDDEDATNDGKSAEHPAEGDDAAAPEQDGSPRG